MSFKTKIIGLAMVFALSIAGSGIAAETQAGATQADQGKFQWYANRNGRPSFPPAVAKLVSEGIALINKSQCEQAITKFDLALKEMPDGASIYENRGVCYQQLGKFDLAVADYTKALDLAPEMGGVVYANRGYSYKSLGKPDLAVADFTKVMNIAPQEQVPLLLERGKLLVDLGDVESAEKDFNKAIKLPPIRARAYSELAYISQGRRDFPKCIALASKAIRADGKLVDGWVNRGVCEITTAKYERAVKDLSTAIRLEPAFAAAYVNRSAAYVGMGNCREAREDAKTVAKLAPDMADLARKIVSQCK